MLNLTAKWERKVRDYCDSQYEVIQVKPGDINFYFKCHLVASHMARKYNQSKIALVMARDKKLLLPIIHFINYSEADQQFKDNTYGELSIFYEYRFIRWISQVEFDSVSDILTDTRTFFRNMAGPLTRWLGNCEA